MAKRIYPGNQINRLSSYQGQPVIAQPGRAYYNLVGYALITSTGATSWPITIPSPDMRADDKPRPDIASMVIPLGAKVYHIALRAPDMRKDRALGTARTGIVGTNTNTLRAATAVNVADVGALADDAIGTPGLAASGAPVVADTTIVPAASQFSIITPVAQAAARTIEVFSTTTLGNAAGSAMTSTETGGTPVIVEVSYFLEDLDVADLNDIRLPFLTESL